jgi:dihydrofolate reductase
MISAILAIADNNVIGNNGSLPWNIKEDMQWFKNLTTNNVVIMGRNTWNGLNGPLKNRINVVVASHPIDNVDSICDLIEENISAYQIGYPDKEIFIIGGAKLYESMTNIIDKFYVTRIHQNYDGDTKVDLNNLLLNTNLIDSQYVTCENGQSITFEIYERKR